MGSHRSSSVNSKTPYQARLEIANQWLRSFDDICRRLDGTIQEYYLALLKYIIDNSDVGEPIVSPDRKQYGIRKSLECAFSVVPLTTDDQELHPYFKQIIQPTYRESEHAIYLPTVKVSTSWRGLIFFHEICHAKNHVEDYLRTNEEQTDDEYWQEEYEAYSKEAALASSLYGNAYDKLANRFAEKLEKTLRNRKATNQAIEFDMIPHAELNAIFGPPLSPMERGARRGLTTLDFAYRAFDKIYAHKPGDHKEHIAFTKQFCKDNTEEHDKM